MELKKAIAKKVYIETYGCQMNVNDSEIVAALLEECDIKQIDKEEGADIVLLNTCSVRENAENKILERLKKLSARKRKKNRKLMIGVIGCMAEKMQEKLLETGADLVVGPDEYRRIGELVDQAGAGIKPVAINLSLTETYSDIAPRRNLSINGWISIMRGCNNFCSYCVVPYTRGRERSKPINEIMFELKALADKGFKEATFLGQNVNSYWDESEKLDFADMLLRASDLVPEIRLRFATSHPKDISDKLIQTIASRDNLCKHIHLPVQSGSNFILKEMNRKYTVEQYLERVAKIREIMPKCAITTDIIAGFPGESEEDHQATIKLMQAVNFDGAFMFKYSPREGTAAYSKIDDVLESDKTRRLNEIIDVQNALSKVINHSELGAIHEIIVEGVSKRKATDFMGRSDTNKIVVFTKPENVNIEVGDRVKIKIIRSSSATMFGEYLPS